MADQLGTKQAGGQAGTGKQHDGRILIKRDFTHALPIASALGTSFTIEHKDGEYTPTAEEMAPYASNVAVPTIGGATKEELLASVGALYDLWPRVIAGEHVCGATRDYGTVAELLPADLKDPAVAIREIFSKGFKLMVQGPAYAKNSAAATEAIMKAKGFVEKPASAKKGKGRASVTTTLE